MSLNFGVEKSPGMSRWIAVLLSLYFVAILVSISAMEAFSTLVGLLLIVMMGWERFRYGYWPVSLSTGIDAWLWSFAIVVLIGLWWNPVDGVFNWSAATQLMWIPTLYVLVGAISLRFPGMGQFVIISTVATLVAAYGISQFFFGWDWVRGTPDMLHRYGDYWRTMGVFNNPMTYGHSYAMVFFLPLAMSLINPLQDRMWRVLFGLCALIIGISLITTQTRGVWIGTSAGIVVLAYCLSRRAGHRVTLSLSAMAVALMVAVPTLRDRVFSIFDMQFANNANRLKLWQANWEIFLDYPIFGSGYGQNELLLMDYYQKLSIDSDFVSHAHNTYLHFLAGTGALGLFAYLVIATTILVVSIWLYRSANLNPTERALMLAAIGAQVAFHIGGMTECNFEDTEVNHVLMVYWALVIVIWQRQRRFLFS